MKWNWGFTIITGYLVFVIGILFMVFRSTREKFDLVTDDYYEQEIRYQQRIEESLRSAALEQPVKIVQEQENIVILFPTDNKKKSITGKIWLYFPADSEKDIIKDFIIENNRASLAIPPGNSGQHEVKVFWTMDGKRYYSEKKLFIHP